MTLAESEARFRSLFDAMPLALFRTTADGTILEANPALVNMLGYPSREALLATNAFDHYVEPTDRQRYVEALERTGVVRGFVTRLRRLDGTEIDIELAAQPVRDAKGRIVHIEGSMGDCTERLRADAALRLQSAALDAAANAIVIMDRAGTVVWTNPAYTTLTGFTADEAMGRNPRDLVKSGVHNDAFYEDLWTTVLAGKVWHGEMTNRRKDGTLFTESQTITPVKNEHGEITHFISIKQDLTETKRLEAQYLQAQKMETVGHLTGGIAHDFNNLLGVITVFGELAGDGLAADDPRRDDLKNIQDAVQRAATLTRQLLAFSRQQVLHPEVLDPNVVITDLLKMLSRTIGEDIALVTALEPSAGRVRVDKGQLEQVFLNLTVNARDAMPGGGQFRIASGGVTLGEAAARERGLERAGEYAVFTITDTGTGMSAETLGRMFEPFFSTKGAKGSGLGLATVYGIIRQSSGSIAVSSRMGEGTTFTIHLPQVKKDEEERRAKPREAHALGGSETILLVEDDPAIRLAASTVLMRLGYHVLVTNTSEEALAQATAHSGTLDLVVTDLVLPGLDGLALIGRLRDSRPGIKALVMSGYPSDSRTRRETAATDLPFMEKPFNSSDLARRVRDVLDG